MEIIKMSDLYSDRLRDESRMTGSCDTLSVPADVRELQTSAKTLWDQNITVTIQGGRTGICGCAVPNGGHIISTEKLNKILGYRRDGDRCFVSLEPGVMLTELRAYCREHVSALSGKTFLPNPSETLATLGGMFACNARGMNSALHGDTVGAVSKLKMIVPSGARLNISRGSCVFDESGCDVPGIGRLEVAQLLKHGGSGKGPAFAQAGSDLIDVIGGSEGMLGIVTELELELKKPAPELWGVLFFFYDKTTALSFAESAIRYFKNEQTGYVSLSAAEYLDGASMKLVNNYKKQVTLLKALPDFPTYAQSAIYVELEGVFAEETEAVLEELLELFASFGGEEENTWAADGEETEKFRLLRHAVPEAINDEIDKIRLQDSRVCKLCTDLELPDMPLCEAEARYNALLSENGLRGFVFGHTCERRLHFNIVPRNIEEYLLGKSLVSTLIESFAAEYDGISWENGIGKTKRDYLSLLGGRRRQTAEIKMFFDEKGLLNPGNML